jgi:peptide/nickel transport system substrate-binding protein
MKGRTAMVGLMATLALAVTGCSTGGASSTANPSSHGTTATFAMPPNEVPNEIFPLVNLVSNANLFELQYLLYRPLYWFGSNGTPVQNPKFSIGNTPTYSNGGRTVTITMKHYRWSDGKPVTNRDVEFWMNLLKANKLHWFDYVPGLFPDNVTGMSFPSASPYTFSLTFKTPYSHTWLLYNELSQVIPIPQHTWDKTSGAAPIGNYDTTPSGAVAVFKYITSQAQHTGTYASNPLWRVVDGPWKLTTYNSGDGYAAFTPNPDYSGPRSGNVSKFVELPFTNDSSEYFAVKSGKVTYGYIPSEDANTATAIASAGYKVADWTAWGYNSIVLNYTNPVTGPLFKQLYIRQALQDAIDQPGLDLHVFDNTAYPTYGPVPIKPPSPFLSPVEKSNPYPFDLSKAKTLLVQHGWTVTPGGTDTCANPGTGAGQCGAGIAVGQRLSWQEEYASGSAAFTAMNTAIQSDWAELGINVQLKEEPTNTIFLSLEPCQNGNAGCTWSMANIGAPGSTPTYSPDYYPTGETFFATGAQTNVGGYSDPVMNALIAATETDSSLSTFYRYEDFAATQLPDLWEPNFYYQISAISNRLSGALPQNPNLNINPELWTIK